MKNICLLNYGFNNIYSIHNALSLYGNVKTLECYNKRDENLNFDILIIPGVGTFKEGMLITKKKSFDKLIYESYINGKSILGICLGFQLLFSKSYEFGVCKGLGILEGEFISFSKNSDFKRNIGWNKLTYNNNVKSNFETTLNNKYFYHVHSFFLKNYNEDQILTYSKVNNFNFISSVLSNNVMGVQFHPEKSGINGLNFLKEYINNV